MSKFINIHMIHNYPVSCLNRDDANAPKDCEFGGHIRARISSQCLKRAVRTYLKDLLPEKVGTRSRQFPQVLMDKLAKAGKDTTISEKIVHRMFDAFAKITNKDEEDSEEKESKSVLLHVPPLFDQKLDGISNFIVENWDNLAKTVEEKKEDKDAKKENGKKEKKWIPKKDTPENELLKLMEKFVGSSADAIDIALFGRMVASNTEFTVDGVCSVAHSISTNKIKKDTDFFTAVDELNTKEDTGAGMMGNIDFNSACYYQCASINYTKLEEILKGDAKSIALVCIEAFAKANPTGKQNTMFAVTPPDCILITIGNQQFTYANAFVDPIRPNGKSLTEHSIEELIKYNDTLTSSSYFKPEGVYTWSLTAQVPNGTNNFEQFMKQVEGGL